MPTGYNTFTTNQPNAAAGGGGGGGEGKRVDLNVMKRNMSIAKGFLDISLLSANANQLKNLINYGDKDDFLYYVIVTSITISLILQVSAGVALIVAERFDINKEEEQQQGDSLNTLVITLMFIVLIINVFVSGLGSDLLVSPFKHHHPHSDALTPTILTTTTKSSKIDYYG